MSDLPNLADIRRFLRDYFSDEELETLCFDYFAGVYGDFTASMSKTRKILHLLDYCQGHELSPNLLVAIQRERPEQYARWFPQAAKLETCPEPAKPVRDPRQVFISHAHQDAEIAHRLAHDLQKRGLKVWIVPESIRPGEKWVEAINRGLSESGVFTVILTPAAVKSSWVTAETNTAISLEHRGKLRFLPLDFERCDVPPLWSGYEWLPLRTDYEGSVNRMDTETDPQHRRLAVRKRTEPTRVCVESARARLTEKYFHLASKAKEIEVAGLTLKSFHDHFDMEDIMGLVKKGKKFRILVLFPTAYVTRIRQKEETTPNFVEDISASLKYFEDIHKIWKKEGSVWKGRLEVRFYDTIPYFAYFGAGRVSILGFYFHHKSGLQSACIQIQEPARARIKMDQPEERLAADIRQHFETLWDDNKANTFCVIGPKRPRSFIKSRKEIFKNADKLKSELQGPDRASKK